MILVSRRAKGGAYRTLREAPLVAEDKTVDITLFANYYGTLSESKCFNDPDLYTDKKWYSRLFDELKEMKRIWRNRKACRK